MSRNIFSRVTSAFKELTSGKTKEKELLELAREIGIYKDDTYERYDSEDFNPSDFDLSVYDQMLKDGQVKAGLDIIKLSATAHGFEVSGDDEETKQYAQFIEDNFEQVQGNLEDTIREMLSALEYGYSCTEKVFEYDQKTGKIMLKKLKTLDPHTLRVKTNQFGDIEYVRQYIGSQKVTLPANKVMWFANDRKFGNPYGHSALRQIYKHWYIKDKLYRFANIAYERYGTPLLVGHVQDAKDVNKMRRLLEKINGLTGLAISGGDSIQAIQGNNADFIGYIEHHDRKIMEGLLVPPMLLGLSRGQSGSYALSGNQFDIFLFRLQSLQRDIKSIIEEQIIRPLVDLNFPNAKRYPSFNFRLMTQEDIEKLSRVFQLLISARVISPEEDWLRERLGFPPINEERKKAMEKQLKGKDNPGDDNSEEKPTKEEDSSKK